MRSKRVNERRGVILLVVLALLTLFAIVGIAFVLYADSEATSARIAREAETAQRADMDPEQALAFFLSQLIYDMPDDITGVGSSLRGHSLVRTMFGINYTATPPNPFMYTNSSVPYCGVGRLHYTNPLLNTDDYLLVNYTWFAADGFLRDPERVGTRTAADLTGNVQPNPYVGGNAPYTYPDLNSFFLAAVKADGTVLAPSYHRPWLFNPGKAFNDMTNLNWTNKVGKYLTLRPRPAEHPNFPAPDDTTGDVKNLVWAPGGNDSIWIDIGAPVMTAPDGTKYKMLVAPFIMDLDSRINLNTAGNILGQNNSHVSNQGWGPWEVNLAKVLYGDSANNPTEYVNLFVGQSLLGGTNTVYGKYMQNPNPPPAATPTTPGSAASSSTSPHFFAPVDFNGLNEAAPGTASSRPAPPAAGATATNCFPQFLQGYLNGGTGENVNHPLQYNIFQSLVFTNNINTRVFQPSDMEALLRPNSLGLTPVDSGSSALLPDLLRLCPQNFGPAATSPRYRNLVTTFSMDRVEPGVSAYWYSLNGTPQSPYSSQVTNPMAAPVSNAVPFPTVVPGQPLPNIANNPPTNASEFGPDWLAASATLGRILLNQPLPPYPHMGMGTTPPYQPASVAYGTRYDTASPDAQQQFQAALSARQTLADNIYRHLLAITGVQPPLNPAAPTSAELIPRRWLAQLAVNIVDYIDEDDISTPFNFYTNLVDGLDPTQIGATQGGDDNGAIMNGPQTGANPLYWVFGTELPKVVLNEVLAETPNADPAALIVADTPVKLWLELYNTMQTLPPNQPPPNGPNMAQQQDGYRVPLYVAGSGTTPGYSPYLVTICQNLMPNQPPAANPLPDASANVLGKANVSAPFPISTADVDFQNGATLIGGGNQPAPTNGPNVGPGVDPQSFFLIGPQTLPAGQFQDPFVAAAGTNPGVPANTPVVRTDSVGYKANWTLNSTTDERTTGLTVLLRRLANPYLPFDPKPSIPDLNNPDNPGSLILNPTYNPYVTIDYIQNVPLRSSTNPPGPFPFASRGKCQPYAALTQLVAPAMGVPPNPANVLASSPVTDQIVNPAPPPQGAITVPANTVTHTFGMPNFPLPQSGHYDWLVHLDRPVISPMELLHVSGWQPYQLTQRFLLGSDDLTVPANLANMFGHYVPWLDTPPPGGVATGSPWWYDSGLQPGQTHRLYRLFEFLECGDRAAGVNSGVGTGRIPGRVNINTIWDAEILQALIDANLSIGIPVNPANTPTAATDPVAQIFTNLLASRSPNYVKNQTIGSVNMGSGADDRPFLPLSFGANSGGTGTQFPNGINVSADTLLRLGPQPQMGNPQLLLFQNPADTTAVHPYLQTQILTKLYNNVTTRSNVFAVFVTVGFFEVTDSSTTPPTLGTEIGRSEGRQVRHRMFAIVDRTNLTPGLAPGALFDPRINVNVVPYYSIID